VGQANTASMSLATLVVGASAGCAAAIVTYPFGVLKTFTQLENVEMDVVPEKQGKYSPSSSGEKHATTPFHLLPLLSQLAIQF